MATWTGTTPFATKKQLFSSISGLVDDINDLNISSISQVSTITATQWMSTPVLYVSDIQGIDLTISSLVSTNETTTNLLTVSSIGMKGFDSLVDLDVEFNFGLGQAIGGLLGGLGALVGGATIAVGTGAGLAIKGAEEGIATMVAGRPQNFINSNVYEQLNFQTQLQISTLGNDYPLYSSIFRTVSSSSANSTPGLEIFTSSFFLPGTTVIRSASDPFHLITGDSNLNTSTIQSFGQWTPLPVELLSTFADVTIQQTTSNTLLDIDRTVINPFNQKQLINTFQQHNFSNDYNYTEGSEIPYLNDVARLLYHRDEFFLESSYFSTTYYSTLSTVTNGFAVAFIVSSISTPLFFTYSNDTQGGNFAICEPDQTGFRSTGTMDFAAINQDLLIQWGLASNNHNSTIAANTAKRVSWDIVANTCNFVDIPPALSSIVQDTSQQIIELNTNPLEIQFITLGYAMNPSRIAWDVSAMTFGASTTTKNYNDYPYQFNSSVFVNGTLEAETLIVNSTIFAISTIVENAVSTSTIYADYAEITQGYLLDAYTSSLKASANWPNDYIYSLSRHRMMGFQTPLSLVVGQASNVYDPNCRFDFVTDQFDSTIYVESRPANLTIMAMTQSNVKISNLEVANLTTSTLIYSNATAPYIETSTISFGYTGDFAVPLNPDYSLQQSVVSPPGFSFNNYGTASNQILKIMGFSNSVTVDAQPFSTLFTAVNNSFGGSNIEGWASTIFANNLSTPVRANLVSGTPPGQISFQANSHNIIVTMNTVGGVGGLPSNLVPVTPGSTIAFYSDGTNWSTFGTAPVPGVIQYNNSLDMTLDFERLNISTNDTLSLNAERIELNGSVIAPNLQLSNLYLNGFMSSFSLNVDAKGGGNIASFYSGSYNGAGQVTPMNYQFQVSSFDFLNNRSLVTPSRGFNLFNSYNIAEWNNSVFLIDTAPGAGPPTIIVGEVIATNPPAAPYAGQFWLNNDYDATPLNTPIYLNTEGVLTVIGTASGGGTGYTRVATTNGTTWTVTSNVPNPQGITPALYNSYYNVALNTNTTVINSGMPMIYNMPSLLYNTNKTTFYSPQIRVATIDAPTFNTREAGMEQPFYYDSNISFTKEGATSFWYSDAFNPILGIYSNTYYSIAGWQCFASLNRLRISGNAVSGWELAPTAYPVGGGATDYVWGTSRYVRIITDELGPSGNLREDYIMIPKNYFNFAWQGQQPWI